MPQTLNPAGAFVQRRGPASLGLLPQSCPPRGPHQARAADSAAAGLESPSRDQGCDRTPGSREPAQPPPHRRRDGGLGLGDSAAAGTSSAGTSRSPWRSPDTPRPRCAAQNRAGTDRVPGTWEAGSRSQDGGPTTYQGQRPQQDRKSPPPTLGLFA